MSKWGQTLALLKQQQQRTLSEQAPPPPQRMFSMQIGSPDWQVAGRVEAPAPATQELLEPRYPPPKEVIDERGAVPIKMFAHVMSLSGIDSKEQRFEVELFVQARRARARGERAGRGRRRTQPLPQRANVPPARSRVRSRAGSVSISSRTGAAALRRAAGVDCAAPVEPS